MVLMKTLAILLLAALSLTTGCVTDEAPRSGTPGRPAYKPPLGDTVVHNDVGLTEVETELDEVDPGSDAPALDPRTADTLDIRFREWAEEVVINDVPRTVIHHIDGRKELLD
jgi:hypothetical protein